MKNIMERSPRDRRFQRTVFLLAFITGIACFPIQTLASPIVDSVLAQGDRLRLQAETSKTVESWLAYADYLRDNARRQYFVFNQGKAANDLANRANIGYQYVIEELEPHNAYALVNLGVIALMKARHPFHKRDREVLLSVAHAKLMQADEKRKGYAEAHVYMAELYTLQEDWSRADAKLKQLVNSNIENSYIQSLWGYVLLKQKRKIEAKQHLLRAIELGDPQSSATWARHYL